MSNCKAEEERRFDHVTPEQLTQQKDRPFEVGDLCDVNVTDFAHGGEGIARVNGHVVFVRGGIPGDVGQVRINEVKKRFARGEFHTRTEDSPLRVPVRCLAASKGGGCCDFSAIVPDQESDVKASILKNQLSRIGKLVQLPEIEVAEFGTLTGWRTRVRLGVDEYGRVGVRKRNSREVVAGVACAQWAPGIAEEVFSHEYRPGAEVVAVIDDAGQVHIAETKPPARGHRVRNTWRMVSGENLVVEEVDDVQFDVPVTAFWQAHRGATQFYADTIREWIAHSFSQGDATEGVGSDAPRPELNERTLIGWDLYGGTGAFVPAIAAGLNRGAHDDGLEDACATSKRDNRVEVHSVEFAKDAAQAGRRTFQNVQLPGNARVRFHTGKVEAVVGNLPRADVVVLDPPRVGAGDRVIARVAETAAELVIHIGCDPATFARDAASWERNGYALSRILVVNAFPGTHHFETIGLFTPQSGNLPARHL